MVVEDGSEGARGQIGHRSIYIQKLDTGLIRAQLSIAHGRAPNLPGARTHFDPWTSEQDNNLLWLCFGYVSARTVWTLFRRGGRAAMF